MQRRPRLLLAPRWRQRRALQWQQPASPLPPLRLAVIMPTASCCKHQDQTPSSSMHEPPEERTCSVTSPSSLLPSLHHPPLKSTQPAMHPKAHSFVAASKASTSCSALQSQASHSLPAPLANVAYCSGERLRQISCAVQRNNGLIAACLPGAVHA